MPDIVNTTKKHIPKLSWSDIQENILGKKYSLSLVFADDKLIKKLNIIYRNKNKTGNTLSFGFSKTRGEIFLNLPAGRQASSTRRKELLFLFIHSLLHLKGLKHSRKMEKEEQKFLKKFSLH